MSGSETLDLSHPSLNLSFLPTRLSIVQFSPTQRIPAAYVELLTKSEGNSPFISITRTRAEVSIIVATEIAESLSESLSREEERPVDSSGPWYALKVKGPMDLSLTGIMHALTGPLRDAQVPVFASSTWDTDYILVNADKRERAYESLVKAGWTFEEVE